MCMPTVETTFRPPMVPDPEMLHRERNPDESLHILDHSNELIRLIGLQLSVSVNLKDN